MCCPQLQALMVNGCSLVPGAQFESKEEFFVFSSGSGGFTGNDIIFDYDPSNNQITPVNNDINTGANPCGIKSGAGAAAYAGLLGACGLTSVFTPPPSEEIPPGVIVIVMTSSGSSYPYSFGALCSTGATVYLYASTCSRTQGAFSNSNTNAGTKTYTLNINGAGCASSTISYSVPYASDANGTYIYNGAFGNDGCAAPPVDLGPLPPAPTIQVSDPCDGADLVLTASPASFDSYIWTLNNLNVSPQMGNTLTIPNADLSDLGPYSVRGVQSCATSESTQITIAPADLPIGNSVIETPVIELGVGNEICVGQPFVLQIDNADDPTATYVWEFPDGTIQNGNFVLARGLATAAMSGTYYVYLDAGACQSPLGELLVNVSTGDPVELQSPINLCEADYSGITFNLEDLIVGNPISGIWNVDGIDQIDSDFNPASYSGQTVDIIFQPLGSCASDSDPTQITVAALTLVQINEPATECASETNYDLSDLLDDPTIDGTWTINGNNVNDIIDLGGYVGNNDLLKY